MLRSRLAYRALFCSKSPFEPDNHFGFKKVRT